MASINDFPMELMIHLLDYGTNDDFFRMSNVSRRWLEACQLKKFPLEKVSFELFWNNRVGLTIKGRYNKSYMTSILLKQTDATHVEAEMYQQRRRTSHGIKSTHFAPGDYMLVALEKFINLIKDYHVDTVKFDMSTSTESVSLLTDKLSSSAYKCQTLSVYAATNDQIDVLSKAIKAHNYTLHLCSDLLSQPLPMNSNILRCPGSLITHHLTLSNEISLLKCQHLVSEEDSTIDLSILEKWGQDFRDGVAGRKRNVWLNGVKARYDEVEQLVKRHSNATISRRENNTPGGAPFLFLSCEFENSEGIANLSFCDNFQGDGYYSVKFLAVKNNRVSLP